MTKIAIPSRGTAALAVALAAALGACAYPEPQYAPVYAQPAPSPYAPPSEVRGSVAPRYANSGVVTSIERLQAERQNVSPVGAIAGAVIGGLLGNQVGAGGGKAAATVAGVAAGGFAGNEIGRRAEAGGAPDLYRIGIQYDGGGTQYIEVSDPGGLRPGERVRVDGRGQISRY